MFLEKLLQENRALVEAAIQLHQSGSILPDTYVIDLEMIRSNAQLLAAAASQQGIELFFMTKQLGRNPLAAKAIIEAGISHAVAVDFKEALLLMEHNIALGNVGHLVQIPTQLLAKIIAYRPKYITVYSLEKLRQINAIAKDQQIVQSILLKVVGKDDMIYPGQSGGIWLEDLVTFMQQTKDLANIQIAGLTAFPCLLYDSHAQQIRATANATSLQQAKQTLAELGYGDLLLNMPSATSVSSLSLLAQLGASMGEPGHAFSATTPDHRHKKQPEQQAMLYLSEVSHHFDNQAYIYGGGYYRRSGLTQALVAQRDGTRELVGATALTAEAIDYHLQIDLPAAIGSSVIMAFRTQIFATRSQVAVVSGIASGNVHLEGIYDSAGRFICNSY